MEVAFGVKTIGKWENSGLKILGKGNFWGNSLRGEGGVATRGRDARHAHIWVRGVGVV